MGQALETVEDCKVLIKSPLLTVTVGKYSYRIQRKGNQSEYTVTDGVESIAAPIRWAMGASSSIGQTYILEKDGELYESRVSYYRELRALAPTLGSENSVAANLREALGRLMTREDKLSCFGCHSTNAVSNRQFTPEQLRPGVQCNHCHEGSDAHLLAVLQFNEGAASDFQSQWQVDLRQRKSQIFAANVIERGGNRYATEPRRWKCTFSALSIGWQQVLRRGRSANQLLGLPRSRSRTSFRGHRL